MSESSKLPFAVNLAVVIGINNYQNGFSPLGTARFDAERFARILQDSYHYDVTLLTDEQATSENIWNHLKIELLEKIKSYQDKRQKVRLLFYFAGHGTSPQEEDKGGALVPQDGETTNQEKWLLMDDVKTALTNLKCDHLLIILDCCFAGSFRTSTRKFVFKKTEELSKERYDNYIKFPAAQVIASAAHDQTAADTYSFKDNRGKIENSGHSPFAYFLFEALEKQAADYTKDGITTATELNLYLFEELQKQKQICRAWNLPNHDKGEFFFQTGDFDPNNLPDAVTLSQENNPYRGLESFNEAHSRFFFGRNEAIENLTNKIAGRLRRAFSEQPLTVVLGSSGSGKSSLVKAGLIPKIREEQAQWQIFEPIRLGSTPFTALAKALLPLILQCSHLNLDVLDQLYELEKILRKKRREDSNNLELKGLFTQWRRTSPEEQLLLIIQNFDQLKEVCGENFEQQKALENLRKLGLTNSRIVLDKLKDIVSNEDLRQMGLKKLIVSNNSDDEDKRERYCNSEEKKQLTIFYRECQDKIERCRQDWSNNGESFGSFLNDLLHKYPNNQKILLVIDQFEELITQSSEKKREEFLNALQSALQLCPEQLRLVVTLRDDFKHDFENKPQLKDHWKNACFTIPQMGRNQLREVIEEPASVQVLYFEEKAGNSLSEQLLDDIGDTSGVLPLLSFTLSELYYKYVQKDRRDRTLRWEDYEELGGVTQALTNKATEEYENLKYNLEQGGQKSEIEPSEAQARQTLLRWVMLRMINLDGGVRTKRAVLEDELQYSDEETNKRRELVINRFVDARLFLTGTNLERKTYFEPAHDILIREWDKIKIWLGGTAEAFNETQGQLSPKSSWFGLIPRNNRSKKESTLFDLNLQRQLTSAATEWDKNTRQGKSGEKRAKKAGGWLWNGNARLPLAREVLLSPTDNWLNQVETEFVKSSIGKERQNRNRLIGGVSTFIVVLIAGLGFSLLGQAKAREGQITASQQASEANFRSNEQLNALVDSLRAGKLLKDWPWYLALFQPESDLQPQVGQTLRNIFYGAKERNRWEAPPGRVWRMFFSNDQLLMITSNNDEVELWDSQNNQRQCVLEGQKALYRRGFSVSSDGTTIATATEDGIIRLWDSQCQKLTEFQAYQRREPETWQIEDISFSPDGNTIATIKGSEGSGKFGKFGQALRLWDLQGNKLEDIAIETGEEIIGLGFNVSDHVLIALWNGEQNKISVEELSNNKRQVIANFSHNYGGVDLINIKFSFDGKQAIINYGSESENADLWNFSDSESATPNAISNIILGNDSSTKESNPKRFSMGSSFSAGGNQLAATGVDGTVYLLESKGEFWDYWSQFKLPQGRVGMSIFTPDGKQLVTLGDDNMIRLWDLKRQPLSISNFAQNTVENVENISFSPDEQTIASVDSKGVLRLLDLEGNLINELTDIPEVRSVSFSPDGQTIATTGDNGMVRLLDLQGNLIKEFQAHPSQVSSVSWSHDGQKIATIGDGGYSDPNDPTKSIENSSVSIWDTTGNKLDEKKGDSTGLFQSVSFDSNDEPIIVRKGEYDADFDNIYVSDSLGRSTNVIPGRQAGNQFNTVKISGDGSLLLTTSSNGEVTLWKSNGEKLMIFYSDKDPKNLSLSPDNSMLAVTLKDGTTQLWRLGTFDDLLSTSCDRIGDYLQNNPNVSKEDKKLCDGISELEKRGEISMGDKILVPTLMNPDKLAGVEAIRNGDFQEAIQRLEAYLENTPNDPEALIYLNNARIGNQKSYTIAISAPIGSDENGALEMLRGVAQAQDEINKQRGINGLPLRVLIADDDNKPDTAKQIAEQLVKNPDVLGVIGHYASDVTLAAGKVYETGKLVAISPVSTSVNLTGFGNYIFRTVPSDSIAAKALADYMVSRLEKKNAAVFYNSQSGYSKSLKSEFIKFLPKEGGQVSKKLIFDLSDPNFNADKSVEESIESGAEVLVLLPNTGELDHTLQVLKANNKQLPLLGGDDVYTPKVLKEGAEDSVGMVVAIPWHISASQTNFPDTSRQLWKADVNWRTAMSYDATIALIEGLKNNPSREGLAQTLHSQDFTAKSAATGEVKFKSGDRDREIQLVKIQANPQSRSKTGYDFEPVREYSRE